METALLLMKKHSVHPSVQFVAQLKMTTFDDFMMACRSGDVEVVESCLREGEEFINNLNEAGSSGLHYAAANGHGAVAKILLLHGADVNVKNSSKNTPLHWSCLNGHVDIAVSLLEAGADPFAENEFGNTALDEANSRGNRDLASVLLKWAEEHHGSPEDAGDDGEAVEDAGEAEEESEEEN